MNPPPPHPSSDPSAAYLSAPTDFTATASPAATASAALSQPPHHTPTPNGNARKRRASGVPGSRGVANLTPDQLAKKRANDREAQRAIRERTRNNIESLEARIRELESQQPFQELQKLAAERDRALQECEDLKKKLEQVSSIVGGSQQPNLHELAALTAQQSPLPPVSQQQPQQNTQPGAGPVYEQSQSQTQHEQQPQTHLHPELRGAQVQSPTFQAPPETEGDSKHQTDHGASPRFHPTTSLTYDQNHAQVQGQMQQHASSGERHGLNFLLDQTRHGQAPANASNSNTRNSSPEPPIWTRTPVHSPPASPLDSLLIDFISDSRRRIANGAPLLDVLGPDYPQFTGLKDPAQARGNCHPVSSLLIDVLSKFPDIRRLPEQAAILFDMFLLTRWMICPCEACYSRLSTHSRPLREQLEIPHSAWKDYLPWRHMRHSLITYTPTANISFNEFFVPFTTTVSINWPYDPETVLVATPPSPQNLGTNGGAPQLGINPYFEAHSRDIANWTIGEAFRNTFPELVGGDVRVGEGALGV